jgi:hypothetical protein
MEVQQDFRDMLGLFNAHKVDYLIIGAHALAYHGVPRYTGDMDIFMRPTEENAHRIFKALEEFGFGSVGLTAEDFSVPDRVIQLGVAPIRIDIVTTITGVTWEEAAAGRVQGKYGDIVVYFIGREELVRNKHALGRKKDQADLEALGIE